MMTERQWMMCMKLAVTAMVCALSALCMYLAGGLVGMVGAIVGIALIWGFDS